MHERGLVLAVGPGGKPGRVLQLRVSVDAAPELQALMKDEGVFAGYVVHASADVPQLAMLVGSFAGGLGGIAAVLRVFFGRHQHRSFTYAHGDETFEVKGMSQADMDALIERTLRSSAQDQVARQHLYRSLPGFDDDAKQ